MREKLGNIKQLQDLLFGEQTKEYNRKFDLYHDRLNRLESNHRRAQIFFDNRLKELESKLLARIDSAVNFLQNKIERLNHVYDEESQKVKADLELISQQTRNSINDLQENIKAYNADLEAEIAKVRSDSNQDIELLKRQIKQQLDSSLSELATGKLSRNDLAEILSELSLQLKEPNLNAKTNPKSD